VQIQGKKVLVEGPRGKLELDVHPRIEIERSNGDILLKRLTDEPYDRSLHGATRSLIQNMMIGVTEGFMKELELQGVGFRAQLKGKMLSLALGFSHPIEYPLPEGVKVELPKPEKIVVRGSDKALVGQVAADIRHFFEPEPYQGKGVRYVGEQVRRKQGKTVQ